MKISIIGTRGYPSFYGGFETAVRYLAPYFAELGWGVIVYGRQSNLAEPGVFRDPRVESIQTIGLNAKSLSTLSFGFTSVVHAIFHRPDVALVMNVANGYWLPLLKLFRIRTVVNVDGIEWERQKWGKLAKRVFRLGAELTAKYADSLIFDSISIMNFWQENFGVEGTYIPYGGEIEAKTVPPVENLVPGNYILIVARLVPENSISLIFEAVPLLSKVAPVVLVGTSGFQDRWDHLAAEIQVSNSNFKWLGHISDDSVLRSLWSNAGVYIHGHSVGGTNPALVQAMACGAVIVARDTVYNREVLLDTGLYFEESKDDLIEKVKQAFGHGTGHGLSGKRSQHRASEYFDWEKVCADYAQLLMSVVSK